MDVTSYIKILLTQLSKLRLQHHQRQQQKEQKTNITIIKSNGRSIIFNEGNAAMPVRLQISTCNFPWQPRISSCIMACKACSILCMYVLLLGILVIYIYVYTTRRTNVCIYM